MTAHTLDFDLLKAGLRQLDARMAAQNALQARRERRRGISHLQWGLWPLWLGQTLQVAFGVLCIALGAAVWSHLRDGSALMLSAVLVHAYGVLCIVLAGLTLGRLGRIDRGQSLADTQTQLARLRLVYVRGGMAVGLAWWLLWMPFAATLFFWLSGGRVDFFANMGMAIPVMAGVGVAGLLATVAFHRWSRDARRPRLARAMEHAVTGRSLLRAQQQLDELKTFIND